MSSRNVLIMPRLFFMTRTLKCHHKFSNSPRSFQEIAIKLIINSQKKFLKQYLIKNFTTISTNFKILLKKVNNHCFLQSREMFFFAVCCGRKKGGKMIIKSVLLPHLSVCKWKDHKRRELADIWKICFRTALRWWTRDEWMTRSL